jgi:hypothetical protein
MQLFQGFDTPDECEERDCGGFQSEERRRTMEFDRDLQRLLSTGMLNQSMVAAHFCPNYYNITDSSR